MTASQLDWYLQINLEARQLRLLVTMPRLMRPAGVMWNRSRNLTPGAQLLVSCLKEVADRL